MSINYFLRRWQHGFKKQVISFVPKTQDNISVLCRMVSIFSINVLNSLAACDTVWPFVPDKILNVRVPGRLANDVKSLSASGNSEVFDPSSLFSAANSNGNSPCGGSWKSGTGASLSSTIVLVFSCSQYLERRSGSLASNFSDQSTITVAARFVIFQRFATRKLTRIATGCLLTVGADFSVTFGRGDCVLLTLRLSEIASFVGTFSPRSFLGITISSVHVRGCHFLSFLVRKTIRYRSALGSSLLSSVLATCSLKREAPLSSIVLRLLSLFWSEKEHYYLGFLGYKSMTLMPTHLQICPFFSADQGNALYFLYYLFLHFRGAEEICPTSMQIGPVSCGQ